MNARKVGLLVAGLLAGCEAMPMGAPPAQDTRAPAIEEDCTGLVAIVARDAAEGLARERAWLQETFPGAQILSETQDSCDGVPVDRVVILHDGLRREVVFDASAFFGKVDGDDLNDLLEG